MTESYSYHGLQIQQTPDSKPFYVINCTAKELLHWCDVPRSKEEYMAGYQRELGDRHEKISEYILKDTKNNIIPNSIIVALKDGDVDIDPNENGSAEIKITVPHISLEERLPRFIDQLEQRLSDVEKESISLGDDEEESDEDDPIVPPESYMAQLIVDFQLNSPPSFSFIPHFFRG